MQPRVVALIMAGGGGTRLWPASTKARPKHLLPGLPAVGRTLLGATVDRLAGLVETRDVYVVTTVDQAESIRATLPSLDAAHLILEPCGRNTAPAVALSLVQLRARLGPDADAAIVIALPADHFVADPEGFRDHLAAACAQARATGTIATLGIEPDRAETGYGYMERNDEPLASVDGDHGITAYRALRFVEKPDRETARAYLASGRFSWNAGIFVMPLPTIEQAFARLCPRLWSALADAKDLASTYARVQAVPIDVAIMEKLDALVVVPARVGWSDLGSWTSVAEALAEDHAGNVLHLGPGARAKLVDAADCMIWNEDATVGVLGVSGLAIVVSGGKVLVCALEQAQRVRALADALADD